MAGLVDWCLYWTNPLLPSPLPASVAALGDRYGHHLIITLDQYTEHETTAVLVVSTVFFFELVLSL
jgi:hypothetical protein